MARAARNSLILLTGALLIFGCSSSTQPSFTKKDIEQAVHDICLKESKIDVKTKLVGSTFWAYLPLKGMLVKDKNPKKYTVKFTVEQLICRLNEGRLEIYYLIKPIPPKEETQGYKFDKAALDKMYSTLAAIRRVVFSLDHSKDEEPRFYCMVTADIKDGFEIQEVSHYLDLKKLTYGLLSSTEYQHRTPQEIKSDPKIIGDETGSHILYKDITLAEFITQQIEHRIKLKFEKAEMEKKSDMDKEILRLVVYTVKAYDFKDFKEVVLYNLGTNNKVLLNRAAIFATPSD
ncbi:MAG: hypothetical protein NT088_04645 [Candidatus Omnitrophica bacterium]|nr:hypothetical protein [Candidatus Omnitrophota bacterium]